MRCHGESTHQYSMPLQVLAGWYEYKDGRAWYLGVQYAEMMDSEHYGPLMTGFLAFWTWFILLYQMVPITLVVSSEMVKFGMAAFITWDRVLWSTKTKKPAKVNTTTIPEELGYVKISREGGGSEC